MKLIILDKDGTLTTPKSGKKFVQHPEDQMLLPGVMDALKWHISQGDSPVIVSNQDGVAAGHKSIQDANTEMKYCLNLCQNHIDTAYFCPDFDGNECCITIGLSPKHCCLDIAEILGFDESRHLVDAGYFRKPGPGMLLYAMQEYKFLPQDCLMVGDRPEDEQAAKAAGVVFQSADRWRQSRE